MNRTQLIQAVPGSVRRHVPAVRHLLAFPPRRFVSGTWCLAPTVQMHLLPDGDIRACCRNSIPLGNITEQRLTEIWAGARRQEMVRGLAAKETPTGCENCAAEIATEGRKGSYPEVFDLWTNRLGSARGAEWPIRMEFNLSNRCNLQCIQCSGDLSSSIRIHREGRPALPTVYDDQFFEDVRLFLPHLRHANFAGGEPFLGPENFKVWDAIAELVPKLECTINTNATLWNKRIERVLERGRFSFIFSMDGIHKETYEAIRIDADLDQVLRNIDRFCEYAARRNTDVNINHCLMPQNYAEFGDLLLFAEARHIKVNVSVVRTPRECSLAYLPPAELEQVYRTMERQSSDLLPRLRLNASTWRAELKRIQIWAEHGPPPDPWDDPAIASQPVELRPRPHVPPVPPLPTLEPVPPAEPTILMMPCRGVGPTDDTEARAELQAFAGDQPVLSATVGPDDTIVECSDSLLDVLGLDRPAIVGREVADLQELVGRRFGDIINTTLTDRPDRMDSTTEFAEFEARSCMVALRDDTGWADTARLLIAIRPR